MSYRVTFTSKALGELHEIALWWSEHRDAEQAAHWLEAFETAIRSLALNPERHALARESDSFPFTLRQLLFGLRKRPTHRAVFRIQENNEVIVYGIRHVAQEDFTPNDL
ncbi:MAG: type II toxin-antitoxin system RelE/ParE family toxin [Pirellulaceae bacterium]